MSTSIQVPKGSMAGHAPAHAQPQAQVEAPKDAGSAPAGMKIDRNNWWKKPAGAALGGIVEGFCFHPLDTIKTNIQGSRKHRTLSQTVQYIYAKNSNAGMRNFYKGLTPVTINLSMKYIIRYGVNYKVRELLAGESGTTTNLQNFFAGLCAGTTEALLLVTPFECIKTKMQTNPNCNGNIVSSLRYIIQYDGIRGLWRGAVPTVIRQASNQGCMFTTYTLMKQRFYKDETPSSRDAFCMGLFASCVGPLCNTPFDTIKTRLMKQTKLNEEYGRTIGQCARIIYQNEGIRGMYKGLSMRLLRLCPGQATVWVVVENFNRFCKRYDL